MKAKIICLFLPLFLLSCSKKPTASNDQLQNQPSPPAAVIPFQPTVVEPPETKEIDGIKSQANALLESKDFDGLDSMAKTFRDTKVCYADGVWKLFYFYDGINIPEESTDSEWSNHFAVLRDWIKTKPDSITARVALANGLVGYAWTARGRDSASKVTDDNWKHFSQRLNEAVSVLAEAKTLNEKCPCWWSTLLRVELGLQVDRPQYDAAFKGAIQAWPDYAAFYFIRANFLLPRWYGTEGELEKDLEASADKIGGEAGDTVYAQVIWDLNVSVFSTNLFQEYNLSWNRANNGLETIESHYPDSLAVKNEAAHLAVLAHDPPAAKKYFDQTKGEIDPSAWSSTNEFIYFANLVYGVTQ
jgi:hypothetical protein